MVIMVVNGFNGYNGCDGYAGYDGQDKNGMDDGMVNDGYDGWMGYRYDAYLVGGFNPSQQYYSLNCS